MTTLILSLCISFSVSFFLLALRSVRAQFITHRHCPSIRKKAADCRYLETVQRKSGKTDCRYFNRQHAGTHDWRIVGRRAI